MAQIETLLFEDGERYPLIILDNGVPDFFPTLYVTINLRPKLTANSIRNTLRDIRHLQLWEEIHGRDLMQEFRTGRFLSEQDFESLRDHCGYDTRALRQWLESVRNSGITRLQPRSSMGRFMAIVKKSHKATRLRTAAEYLAFSAKAILRYHDNYADALVPEIEQMRRIILKQVPKGVGRSTADRDPDSKAPPIEVFDALMARSRESAPDNPFQSPAVRERNARLFDLLHETGARSGEILALRIEDIDFHENTISIVRRHDDPLDPRARQPVVKTLPRAIPVRAEVILDLRRYILGARGRTLGANKHPFLFVTHRAGRYQGRPMSDANFRQKILERLVATDSAAFGEVRRHGFRHAFNYRLSQKIDLNNRLADLGEPGYKRISAAAEIKLRKYLNGWASDSSVETYNLRHTQEEAVRFQNMDMDEAAGLLRIKEIMNG